MIQVTVSVSDTEEFEFRWFTFYEDGREKGRIEFGPESAAQLMEGLRAANVRVTDLTAREPEDETATDV